MPALTDIEKAVGQILLNFGIVKDSELGSYVNKLRVDFPDDMFKRMNVPIKAMGLEIRSLINQEHVTDEDGEEKGEDVMEGEGEEAGDKLIRVTYHGIVNTESDVTAEKFGINLKSEELVFFKDCVERLVHNKYQSLHDLVYLSEHVKDCRSGWKADMEALVIRLIDTKWLQRTERAYVELGPRAYMELRGLIEKASLQAVDDEEEQEEEQEQGRTQAQRDELRQEILRELPQMLYY